jgi:hypothetical protein
MGWVVEFSDELAAEVEHLAPAVRKSLLAHASVLEDEGSNLGRPYVDTLKGSAFPNMKELRFSADNGVWRVAFAFDPVRRAILLVAGNKVGLRGTAEDRFYKALVKEADRRFAAHLKGMGRERG